jgi:hypothetical protein
MWRLRVSIKRQIETNLKVTLFFFVGIWSWLADKLHFILSYEAGFYKPTFLKVHPPFLQDYSICNYARLISTQFLLQAFDPNEWCLKNGLLSGGFEPTTSQS